MIPIILAISMYDDDGDDDGKPLVVVEDEFVDLVLRMVEWWNDTFVVVMVLLV